jgi:hypothetical protein
LTNLTAASVSHTQNFFRRLYVGHDVLENVTSAVAEALMYEYNENTWRFKKSFTFLEAYIDL